MKIDDYRDIEVNNVGKELIELRILVYGSPDPSEHKKPYARAVVDMKPKQVRLLASELLNASIFTETHHDK